MTEIIDFERVGWSFIPLGKGISTAASFGACDTESEGLKVTMLKLDPLSVKRRKPVHLMSPSARWGFSWRNWAETDLEFRDLSVLCQEMQNHNYFIIQVNLWVCLRTTESVVGWYSLCGKLFKVIPSISQMIIQEILERECRNLHIWWARGRCIAHIEWYKCTIWGY